MQGWVDLVGWHRQRIPVKRQSPIPVLTGPPNGTVTSFMRRTTLTTTPRHQPWGILKGTISYTSRGWCWWQSKSDKRWTASAARLNRDEVTQIWRLGGCDWELCVLSDRSLYSMRSVNDTNDTCQQHILNKTLSHRRGTARRTTSVGLLSTAAQLQEKWHLKSTQ